MPLRQHLIPLAVSIVAILACTAHADDPPKPAQGPIDFSRDIRPMLAKSCVSCHGKLAQKGGLRLDEKPRAFAGGDSGEVIVPGKSDESPLYRYIAGLEADHVMPPKKSKGPRPSAEEITKVRAWIDQGAKWPDSVTVASERGSEEIHWAFKTPTRPALPIVQNEKWVRNPIDRFVLSRLEKEGLKPAPEADKVTLIRRLSLDLIGLPPTIAEVDSFVKDERPDAYDRLVDRLIASPHYGERWARTWLDKARYADTNGYEKDRERSIWPYRDWVIRALNHDMPFDQFTIKQLAGDMLPDATYKDRIATGFHRNTMRNEEGGIDVEEFRYAALVDRVATTGATWLGLTVQCAQCHTHKYDPITQKEYYQFLAYFNNADEPEEYTVPDQAVTKKQHEMFEQANALEAALESKFPAQDPQSDWINAKPIEAKSANGATIVIAPDGLVTVAGESTDKDVTTVAIDLPSFATPIRIDAVGDPSSPAFGPGRTAHGNFVLTGVSASLVRDGKEPVAVPIASAIADFTQNTFDPSGVLDDNPRTGWAIDDGSKIDKTRSITLGITDWPKVDGPAKLVLTLKQEYGGKHTLGRFRIRVWPKPPVVDSRPEEVRRKENLNAKMTAWEASLKPHRWTVVTPEKAESHKLATMNILADGSVLVTGDKPNNDVYDVVVPAGLSRITAIRLEAMLDASLPNNGPGRAPLYSLGDFILTEFVAKAIGGDDPKAEKTIKFSSATQDFAADGHTAAMAIDGVPESGWTIQGGTGKPHSAVFELAEPLEVTGTQVKLALTLRQFGIHNTTLGRFRISVTGDQKPVKDSGLPANVESAAILYPAARNVEQAELMKLHFLSVAPELSAERAKIENLRKSAPKYPTTLVMQEREAKNARKTHIHRRGEFLSVADAVEPGLPSAFPTPKTPVRDRLDLARWIASPDNPLTARVTVNGMWQSFFGRGLVATTEDFGTRGERPSHPELLDWLAVEFSTNGWSAKAMHRLIVTSATYRQSSKSSPEQIAKDPKNVLLARGARFRVDAETVRDIALTASGLLSLKLGGPSVYPPQPEGVTNLAYGQGSWPTSQGADRYRRGLYTYVKRAAPFAAFSLMDAPSPEVACVRRERSNTPLQALTLLNDASFVETARALAKKAIVDAAPSDIERIRYIFRTCEARMPNPDEEETLLRFFVAKRDRFRANAAESASLAGPEIKGVDGAEGAAWVLLARAVLNLDETITRE